MPYIFDIRGTTIKFATRTSRDCSLLICTNWTNSQPRLLFGSTENATWKSWTGTTQIFARNSCILHHDNASAHTALSVRDVLATKQITILQHPAYSPDLAPSDFFSVPEDKGNIERKTFWWHWWHQE